MEPTESYTLEARDLLGLVSDYAGAINELWNFYIVVILAVVGWLVTLRTTSRGAFEPATRMALCLGYAAFAFMNWFSLSGHYARFNRLCELVTERTGNDVALREAMQEILQPLEGFSVSYVHPFVDLLVLLGIWFLARPRADGR